MLGRDSQRQLRSMLRTTVKCRIHGQFPFVQDADLALLIGSFRTFRRSTAEFNDLLECIIETAQNHGVQRVGLDGSDD